MSNFNFLILAKNQSLIQEFNRCQKAMGGFGIVSACSTPRDAFIALDAHITDAVIVEITIPTADIFEFVEHSIFAINKPLIIAVSSLQEESYYQRAQSMGVNMVYRAPYSVITIASEIMEALSNKHNKIETTINVATERALDERLANIFISSGIPPHIKGYQFLREAVKQSVHTPTMINNITKQLYPAVAEKFNTSPSKVERAIRHAIEVAWSRGKIDNINTIYGIKVFSRGEKPTNGELIALVSDRMIIECS